MDADRFPESTQSDVADAVANTFPQWRRCSAIHPALGVRPHRDAGSDNRRAIAFAKTLDHPLELLDRPTAHEDVKAPTSEAAGHCGT